ncbi:MAG TPA: hypothetical protein VM124_01420 [Candidatus Limnocylindrales bacterium]|nr:hypothetical protein [Candidatus Limnocylindrales bacterium]
MSVTFALIVCAALVGLSIASFTAYKKWPRRLRGDKFAANWKELQTYCKDKATWPLAILEADKLLDIALKKRKLKGRTMGARLVAAQRLLSDNDNVWFAHNLAKKIAAQSDLKLKETDVKDALMGFRQALKDIGALPSGEQRNP